jgi:hypothetical protein
MAAAVGDKPEVEDETVGEIDEGWCEADSRWTEHLTWFLRSGTGTLKRARLGRMINWRTLGIGCRFQAASGSSVMNEEIRTEVKTCPREGRLPSGSGRYVSTAGNGNEICLWRVRDKQQ